MLGLFSYFHYYVSLILELNKNIALLLKWKLKCVGGALGLVDIHFKSEFLQPAVKQLNLKRVIDLYLLIIILTGREGSTNASIFSLIFTYAT